MGGGLTTVGLGLVFEQTPNGAAGKPFTRYTLPALELRQMLARMRELNDTFTLTYTRIAGQPPLHDHAAAEAWRADGCGRRVTLTERAGGERLCKQFDTCARRAALPRACASDELGLLVGPNGPGWLANTLLLSNPYPILSPAGRYCGSSG